MATMMYMEDPELWQLFEYRVARTPEGSERMDAKTVGQLIFIPANDGRYDVGDNERRYGHPGVVKDAFRAPFV